MVLVPELTRTSRYVWFQMRTHHGIYDEVLKEDVQKDDDRHKDLKKPRLTLTECIIALVIALTCVSLHAVFLGMLSCCGFSPAIRYQH